MSLELLDLTTELDAVNAVLASVGESPISSLENTFVDAETAHSLLKQRLKATQLHGWTFNTDLDVTWTPDNQGDVYPPRNILSYKIADKNLTVRGGRLYDRTTQSFTFTEPVTVSEIVLALPFEECPEAMRLFVTIQAGRRFQDRYQGDQHLHGFQARDEIAAWSALLNYEANVAEHNVLSNDPLIARVKGSR